MSNVLAPFQLLELNVISAQDLAPVARSMRTYAIAWVHPDRKLSTRVDTHGHNNPTWNDKFVFRVDEEFLFADTSAIMVEIYAVHWFRDVHVGTVRVLVANLMPPPERPFQNPKLGLRFVALQVRRPSGRPQGILNIGVAVLDGSMRSMPLYSHNASAVGYRHLMGEDNAYDHHNHNQLAHIIKPELRRTKSDTSSMISSVVMSRTQRANKGKKGKASSVLSFSEASPKLKRVRSKASSTASGPELGKNRKAMSFRSDSVLSWRDRTEVAADKLAASIVSGSEVQSPNKVKTEIQESPNLKNSPIVKNSPVGKNSFVDDDVDVNINDHTQNIVFKQPESLLSSSTEETTSNSSEKFAANEKPRLMQNGTYEIKASPYRNSTAPQASPFHNAAAGPRASPFHNAAGPGASPFHSAADGPRASPYRSTGDGPRASPYHSAADGPRGSPFHSAAAGPRASPFHSAATGPRASPFHSAATGPKASPYRNSPGPKASPFHSAAAGPRASPYRNSPGPKTTAYQNSPGPKGSPYLNSPGTKGSPYLNSPARKFNPVVGPVGLGGSHRGTPKATPLHPKQFGKFNPVFEYGTPRRSNLGNLAPPIMTESELGPSPSDVAAAIAKQPPVEDGDNSTVGGWSLDESVEGLQSKLERWRTELPPVYDRTTEFSSFPTTSSTKTSHTRRQTEGSSGLFSCFSNICGCECSIVCGGGDKRKKSRRRTPSVDNTSFS